MGPQDVESVYDIRFLVQHLTHFQVDILDTPIVVVIGPLKTCVLPDAQRKGASRRGIGTLGGEAKAYYFL